MKIFAERSMTNFEFWSGAKDNARMLTYEELEELDYMMEELFPDGADETTINDLFWFDFEYVCELIGVKYDVNKDKIIRDEE